ncbi:MAG: aldo/keto reductase [Pseudomonadota bacterium]
MQTTTLGRTGLEVSMAGLGCGGHSRLGTAYGHTEQQAIELVQYALEQGVNFIDTARAYRTEAIVGKAILGRREEVVISTKSSAGRGDRLLSGDEVVESLELSLTRLQTDYIDVFNLHGLSVTQYEHACHEILPALQKQQALGKIRFLGVTEMFIQDPSHEMLQLALPDDHFDVVMVGFNLLNPSARKTVFPLTIEKNVATQIMFAVRRALSNPEALQALISQLVEAGSLGDSINLEDPLAFVAAHPEVESIVDAAYRFCRHEPGATVTLTGTGSQAHLRDNLAHIQAPRLPDELLIQLERLFGNVDSVSGN